MQISVKSDIAKAKEKLNAIQRKQIPFASALAITRTAAIAADRLGREIKTKFDTPKRYTVNAPFFTSANKKRMPVRSLVGYKDKQARYLKPHVYGEPRHHTRFEHLLISAGVLSENEYVVPGKKAKITRGTFTKVLSALQATTDIAQRSKGKKADQYHVGYRGDIKGIWKSGKAYPALVFLIVEGAPKYREVLSPDATTEKVVKKYFPIMFSKALKKAVETAR